jgi:hypothetical protein
MVTRFGHKEKLGSEKMNGRGYKYMTKEKYSEIQNTMIKVATEIEILDLHGFIETINDSLNLAPFTHPELFNRAHANIKALRFLAESFTTVALASEQLRHAVVETCIKESTRKTNE